VPIRLPTTDTIIQVSELNAVGQPLRHGKTKITKRTQQVIENTENHPRCDFDFRENPTPQPAPAAPPRRILIISAPERTKPPDAPAHSKPLALHLPVFVFALFAV